MAKYVISTTEIIKKVYIADAYTENEALDRYLDQAPDKVEFIGELVYNIEIINEYEYNKEWKPLDPDIGPDQLKDLDIEQRLGAHGDEDYANISYGGTNGDL